MHKAKKVALITGTEPTRYELVKQLEPLLHDYVKIVSFASDSGIKSKVKADLVVISSSLIIDEVTPHIDPGCPIILARRALNTSFLDKLFSIPNHSKVLLVNDTPETTFEVIDLLKDLGFGHINFIPYYPGCRADRSVKLAVTPGERYLVPDFIETTIDIGPRMIDLTTIVEILEKLDLLDEKAHFVSAKYMETIVRLGKQLYNSINKSNKVNEHLIRVLNQINDGIIAFNREGKITVFNQKSEELFKLPCHFVINKNISQIIKDKNLINYLLEDEASNDQLFRINDIEVVISKFSVDKLDSIVCTFKNTKEMVEMENKIRRNLIKKGHIAKYRFNDIIGHSQIIRDTIETARKLAMTDLSILIHGESGTGKELFASAIHNESLRNSGPFLAVNFSALPEDLVESELFGYEEGAFTGAKKGGKIGLFQQANNGTIFLDEIGDTSLKIQARLLRVLQEKEIMRVGGTEIIPVNVRIITATNKDLIKMCRDGKFREDLYYRLRRLYIKIPPLRERLEDVAELVRYFLVKNNRPDLKLSEDVRSMFFSHTWPGNVRELESDIEYMAVVCDSNTISPQHLPQNFFFSRITKQEENEPLLERLINKGNLEEFLFILNTVYRYNNERTSIGRKTISKESRNCNLTMSEEQIRARTNALSELGLIVKPRGRSGMRLTQKGIHLLLQSNLNQ